MVCISRIFADNCAKGAFFRGATEDNGARNDKNSGTLARRRLTGSEFQSVLEPVRDGTSLDEKLSSSIPFDGRSRSRDSLRMISSSMLHYESVPPRVSSKRSPGECALNLLLYINLSNCCVKFARGKESRTVDIFA